VRVSRWVCRIAALGVTITAAVIIANLVRGRAVSGAAVFLVPGLPAVLMGQVWAMAILSARRSPHQDGTGRRGRRTRERDPRRLFFAGLRRWQATAILVLFFLGWLSGMTAFPSLRLGNPASPAPGCPYRLVSHGASTCVSHSTYLAAGAGGQRLAAGILGAFFAMQLGVTAAELARRRTGRATHDE
jgi:hypothetical protein